MPVKLIDDWKRSWRWSSVRAAAIFAVIMGFFVENAQIVIALVALIPTGITQLVIAIIVALLTFIIPFLLRITKVERNAETNKKS